MKNVFLWFVTQSDFLKIAFSAHVNVNSRFQRKRGKIRHLCGRDVRGILED